MAVSHFTVSLFTVSVFTVSVFTAIQLYSLQPHCSYINRANVSQASRGFVSDSWPFLFSVQVIQSLAPAISIYISHILCVDYFLK